MTDTTLLPCPFCGGAAVIERNSGSYGYYPPKLRVVCSNSTFDKGSKCGCRGLFFNHGEHDYDKTSIAEAKAIAAWNTRAAPTDPKPVAWLVSHPMHGTEVTQRQCTKADRSYGWTETPLYASPQPCTDCAALRDEVEMLRGAMSALRETADALERLSGYARHTDGCHPRGDHSCLCGLTALLKEIVNG